MKRSLILALVMLAGFAFGHASSEKIVFKVVDYQILHNQRIVLLQPVLAYDIFGYLKGNSADPKKGDVVRCDATKRELGKTREGDEMTVMSLDCGAVSLDVAGINFRQ